MKCLVVEGSLNSTGIRDKYEGGYIEPDLLGLSSELIAKIQNWLESYAEEHYMGYVNEKEIEMLDVMGIDIAKAIQSELHDSKVGYYSDAQLKKLWGD